MKAKSEVDFLLTSEASDEEVESMLRVFQRSLAPEEWGAIHDTEMVKGVLKYCEACSYKCILKC